MSKGIARYYYNQNAETHRQAVMSMIKSALVVSGVSTTIAGFTMQLMVGWEQCGDVSVAVAILTSSLLFLLIFLIVVMVGIGAYTGLIESQMMEEKPTPPPKQKVERQVINRTYVQEGTVKKLVK